jgi:hypothetical protein
MNKHAKGSTNHRKQTGELPSLATQLEAQTNLKVHELTEHAEYYDVVTTSGKCYTFSHRDGRLTKGTLRRDHDLERTLSQYLRDVAAIYTGGKQSGLHRVEAHHSSDQLTL